MIKSNLIKYSATTFMAIVMTVSAGAALATINSELDFGDINQDVTELQTFLASDSSVYPERLVTGYFGPLTQSAVQRFQCKYSIVCSGNSSTTGYGRVGPRTLTMLDGLMNGGTGGPFIDNNAPVITDVTISTQPTSAFISWTTSEEAMSKVMYSPFFPFRYATAQSVSDQTIDEVSNVSINGLQPNTTYYYALESVDIFGNIMNTVPSNTFRTK